MEKLALRIQKSKNEVGKNVESGRIFKCKKKQRFGEKETIFRHYRRGSWSEGGRINIGYANWD